MPAPFSLFGIEIELMIVDRETLDVRPLADQLLLDEKGNIVNSVNHGDITWSNELVSHVLELKTSEPTSSLDGWSERFHQSMQEADRQLSAFGAGLLGGGMHPWFDPERETHLWTHDDREIYDAFDHIFGCRGHGWSNLQSFHLNLPFDDDESFRRLHSAIRLVLPLIPALAASSPFIDGKISGLLDTRLRTYQGNCARIPSITGGVIPEVYRSESEYREKVFDVIAHDLAPWNPDELLEPEWTNARGAIARFDRHAIEIRVGDAQECPRRDLAIIEAIVFLLRNWYGENSVALGDQENVSTSALAALFEASIRAGRHAMITGAPLLKALGLNRPATITEALETNFQTAPESNWKREIDAILTEGSLSERLLELPTPISHDCLQTQMRQMRECLLTNRPLSTRLPAL
ncbi:MAG: glutamate--cysteine ligase [Verrucomicrobiae bacterium]|nr:glutamate--cysteine ligase [Verrucomicrobiae bacterium]